MTETELIRGKGKVLVWSAYLVGEELWASPTRAKIAQVRALLGGRRSAAWVTLSTPFDDDIETLRQRLDAAWQALMPPLTTRIDALAQND